MVWKNKHQFIYFIASVKYLEDVKSQRGNKELDAIAGSIKDAALHVIKLSPHLPQEAAFAIKNIEGHSFLINFISSSMEFDNPMEKIALLRENRLKLLNKIKGVIDTVADFSVVETTGKSF